MKIKLNKKLSKTKDEIVKQLNIIKTSIHNGDNIRGQVLQLGKKVHEFHLDLVKSGIKPIHHRYMILNRSCKPDDSNFYNHIHPVEDLLQFLEDSDSIKDFEDKTVGDKFTFGIFSNYYGYEEYTLTRSLAGWDVKGFGSCSQKVEPFLNITFRRNQITYPSDLGLRFEWLWNKAHKDGLDHNTVQFALDRLSEWVCTVEKKALNYGVWEKFKK